MLFRSYTKSVVTTAPTAGANGANILGTSTPATAGTFNAGAFTPVNVSGTGSAGSPATAATTFTGSGFSALDVPTLQAGISR